MLRNISIVEFRKMIEDTTIHVIDFRDRDEFLKNKIEGSINLSIDQIEKIIKIIPNKNSRIIVCCARGIRSVAAGEYISELGYRSVYNLEGGLNTFFRKTR